MANFSLIIIIVLLLVVSFLLVPVSDRPQILRKKCRALVLEGGGDKGAWQAGAIKGLIDNLKADEVQYDVVAGVSIGSVNGFFVSSFEKGSEKEMSEEIVNIWKNLKPENLYNEWDSSYFGMLEGLKSRSGFLDNSPFKKFIDDHVDTRNLTKILTIGVTDATNLVPKTFDGNSLSKEDLKTILLASTSMPVVFPYIEYKGVVLIDGGVLINADFKGAINRCKEIATTEEDIIIDAVLPTGHSDVSIQPNQNYSAFDMFFKYRQLEDFKGKLTDLMEATANYPKVQWRNIIMPLKPLPSSAVPIWFTPESLAEMIAMGESDAKEIINNPNVTNHSNPTFLAKRESGADLIARLRKQMNY